MPTHGNVGSINSNGFTRNAFRASIVFVKINSHAVHPATGTSQLRVISGTGIGDKLRTGSILSQRRCFVVVDSLVIGIVGRLGKIGICELWDCRVVGPNGLTLGVALFVGLIIERKDHHVGIVVRNARLNFKGIVRPIINTLHGILR